MPAEPSQFGSNPNFFADSVSPSNATTYELPDRQKVAGSSSLARRSIQARTLGSGSAGKRLRRNELCARTNREDFLVPILM